MKSPEAASPASPEKKERYPDRSRERGERVEDLKRELKVAFWDLQSRDGMQVTVVDFANDPSFAERLNKAKQSGLTTEEMGEAVDFIRDNYGKKRVLYKEMVSLNDGKYSVNTPPAQDAATGKEPRAQTGAETIKDPVQDASDRFTSWAKAFDEGSAKRYEAQRLADEQWSSEFRDNLARIAAEAEMRHQKETQAVEEKSRADAREFEERRAQREREAAEQRAQSEREIQARLEKQKQIELFSQTVAKNDVNQPDRVDRLVAANDPLFETATQETTLEVKKSAALEISPAPQAAENVVSVKEVQGEPLQAEVSTQTPTEVIVPDSNLASKEVNVPSMVTPVSSTEQFQPVPAQVTETPISDTEQVPVEELEPEEIVRGAEPTVTPEVPLVKKEGVQPSVETNESPAFREALQEFTKSYVTLFKNLRQYNNETLDRNGRETSQSVLFNNDIEDVVAFLSTKNAESSLGDEVAKIEKVRVFFVENRHPVKGGMDISSIKGYNFLIDALSAFERSIRGSYEKTKDLSEAAEFVQILEKVHATFDNLDDMVKKMKQHTSDYHSR